MIRKLYGKFPLKFLGKFLINLLVELMVLTEVLGGLVYHRDSNLKVLPFGLSITE